MPELSQLSSLSHGDSAPLFPVDRAGTADWPGFRTRWPNPFTVNVSWQLPRGLQDGEVFYKYRDQTDKSRGCTIWRNFTESFLTEEMGSDRRTFYVWTVGGKSCDDHLNESTRVAITVHTPKPRAKVRDVKCLINATEMNCSWIPENKPVHLFYRVRGNFSKGLKKCDRPYSSAPRSGCYLKVNAVMSDIYILLDTGAGWSTFKPVLEIPSPKLKISVVGDKFNLSWPPPVVGKYFLWVYEVCYKKCNEPKVCSNFITHGEPIQIHYDKRCLYEFQSRARTSADEPPDKTLVVVAIVVPIILSACIILSCYCFRRHRQIICPTIPDPSAIFKEMMLTGNKEFKPTTGKVYQPVPEVVESCKLTLPLCNEIPQENS
ncbi:hypothetical protein FQN60_006489 [Etheostoma spectabile]|uniref:Uncharacterized protein n=1 Tax=Etheostoma spectabile TaxID=54343 RepID=A0A5J5CLH9_9PERO|nr:hypothetical protein FQN60_006096 [Etheostoma spectabile]KAA8582818.1 hypothetical protein FQN60_006489 [Etheostoma spectabile]